MLLTPFKQTDSSRCGPAVIKTILLYYGIDALEDEICERCNHTYELGCDDEGIKKALESYGLACSIYNNQTLEDIDYWIRHHIPVIVDWFTPGVNINPGDMPNGHAGIVVETDKEKIYLLDPEDGNIRPILRNDFMRVWFDWRGRNAEYITTWEDMVIRQIIIAYPKRLSQ